MGTGLKYCLHPIECLHQSHRFSLINFSGDPVLWLFSCTSRRTTKIHYCHTIALWLWATEAQLQLFDNHRFYRHWSLYSMLWVLGPLEIWNNDNVQDTFLPQWHWVIIPIWLRRTHQDHLHRDQYHRDTYGVCSMVDQMRALTHRCYVPMETHQGPLSVTHQRWYTSVNMK